MNNFLIPVDKANHFIAGTVIYSLAVLIMNPFLAILPVLITAGGKEMYDYLSKKGTPDVMDVLFTILGALPVLITKL